MAGALDPSTSDWVTADLIPATGEVPPATWGEGVAENGGFNYYQTRVVHQVIGTNIHDHGGAQQTARFYTYMTAGSYTAYAAGSFVDGGAGNGTISLDGTTLIQVGNGSNGWHFGSSGVTIAADGWIYSRYSVYEADWYDCLIAVRKVSL